MQEAFSQVMCEAMWMGKPLVMTDVSGAADVIEDGINGRIVPKADAAALAAVIRDLAADIYARDRLGSNARKFIEENLTIEK
ncbi:glycosyltransferase, partial [Escherichia coli]|nr:glycosyltransferase [Escherichia coli]